ncbi:C-glycoside deglycosidase beta subunit domain-containing protein [Streptococcus caviae]|uniref:C-glycoside deglycosidase beta subunit domain-containing protein n=1 Tax=Streptococcus sp. 'caviae' TaxID=1915004 RepID=UPI00094B80CA|nr:DUF6379 domain-containing protein [Streptococcus sp. 'caviae']OLN84681.1 hypothetical protein BMI76_00970 [Streptococcus sp. 'caviae']
MFDNNVFKKDSCKNTVIDGKTVGFELETYITYYRAIPLSMVNDIRVKVDGQEVPREAIRCSAEGEDWFTLDEMTTVTTYKWEYDVPLKIRVVQDGGLLAGEHDVELTVVTRTAYIPIPIQGVNSRKVTIA